MFCSPYAYRAATARLTWLLLSGAMGSPGCAAPTPPQAVAQVRRQPPEQQAHGNGLQAGKLVTMGPTGLALPVFLQPLSDDARRFNVAASRALRMVYEEDSDDPSPLQALLHRLQALGPEQGQQASGDIWAASWQLVLQQALARAQLLQAYAQSLRALRRAYQDVYIEDGSHVLRRLDSANCRAAAQALRPLVAAEPSFMVTVEPMGPKTLQSLIAPCAS